jgi:thioredoxin-related protein
MADGPLIGPWLDRGRKGISTDMKKRPHKTARFMLIASSSLWIISVGSLLASGCEKAAETMTSAPASAESPIRVSSNSSEPSAERGWYHDWDKGIAAARAEKKPILVDFYASWCHWCRKMDETTFSARPIKEIFASDWITIKVNTEDRVKAGTFQDKTFTYQELAGAFGIQGLPSLLFIDKDGQPVTIIPGFMSEDKLRIVLEYMKNELYRREVDLGEYIRSKS